MIELDLNNNVIKAAPIAGAAGTEVAAHFMGLTLNEWFYVATIVYIFVQIGLSVYDKISTSRREDKKIEYAHNERTRGSTKGTPSDTQQ